MSLTKIVRDAVASLPPDELTRLELLRMRSALIDALTVLDELPREIAAALNNQPTEEETMANATMKQSEADKLREELDTFQAPGNEGKFDAVTTARQAAGMLDEQAQASEQAYRDACILTAETNEAPQDLGVILASAGRTRDQFIAHVARLLERKAAALVVESEPELQRGAEAMAKQVEQGEQAIRDLIEKNRRNEDQARALLAPIADGFRAKKAELRTTVNESKQLLTKTKSQASIDEWTHLHHNQNVAVREYQDAKQSQPRLQKERDQAATDLEAARAVVARYEQEPSDDAGRMAGGGAHADRVNAEQRVEALTSKLAKAEVELAQINKLARRAEEAKAAEAEFNTRPIDWRDMQFD